MTCDKCNGNGWILICSNCGREASVYFSEITGDIYESCSYCDEHNLEYSIEQVPCNNKLEASDSDY